MSIYGDSLISATKDRDKDEIDRLLDEEGMDVNAQHSETGQFSYWVRSFIPIFFYDMTCCFIMYIYRKALQLYFLLAKKVIWRWLVF